jgi:hypothetical protein
MNCRSRIVAGLVALGTWAGVAHGEDYPFPTLIYQPKHVRSNVATPHTMEQAGYPLEVSMMSAPSYTERYTGGYIGGGRGHGGHGRCVNEGTWGWDYTPRRPMSPHIFLNWSHGRNYQGGTQGYATDAPISIHKIKEHFSRE